MKVAVYYPDSWDEFAIDLRVSMPKGSDTGVEWHLVKIPTETHPSEVQVILEDDE